MDYSSGMRSARKRKCGLPTIRSQENKRIQGGGGSLVPQSEDAQGPQHRLQTANPGAHRMIRGDALESRCTVRKGGTWFVERSPVTNDSDVRDSQKLGSVWSAFAGGEFRSGGGEFRGELLYQRGLIQYKAGVTTFSEAGSDTI
eukprot:1195085-Prorocentrum_minimum.AAC.3